jgi:hypothetical protein
MLIAALVGTVLMYVWATATHMSPLGMTGLNMSRMDPGTVEALKTATGDKPGLYTFPAYTEAELSDMAAVEAKQASSPSGIVLYAPAGEKAMTPTQLIGELVLEFVEMLLALWLLSKAGVTGVVPRVGIMAVIGVLAAMTTNAHYWLWYKYPIDYTLVAMLIEFGKYVAGGIGAALMLGWLEKRSAASPA